MTIAKRHDVAPRQQGPGRFLGQRRLPRFALRSPAAAPSSPAAAPRTPVVAPPVEVPVVLDTAPPGFRQVFPESCAAVLAPTTSSVAEVVAEAELTQNLESPATEPVPAASRPAPQRDRYIDVLRVLALGRVVLYHLVGWAWLTIAFPSMGIMFALAGSLTAASLDRHQGHYVRVLLRRMRRLLPPYWAFGAVMIAAMAVIGWRADAAGHGGPDWGTMIYWVLPLAEPPSSAAVASATVPLWYISAYLWLVLLSPALLWTFRRWPLKTLAAAPIALLAVAGSVLVLWGPFEATTLNLLTYAACWMLGFAHHDGRLRAVPLGRILLIGAALAGAGLAWAIANPDPETGVNVTDIPVAAMLYSLGVVLILLRCYVDMSWLTKVRWLDALVAAVNRRALTIYLWGNVCIDVALWALARYVDPTLFEGNPYQVAILLGAAWALIWVVVLALGWVEDLAAGRPLRISPFPRRAPRHARAPRRGRVGRGVPQVHPREAAVVGGAGS